MKPLNQDQRKNITKVNTYISQQTPDKKIVIFYNNFMSKPTQETYKKFYDEMYILNPNWRGGNRRKIQKNKKTQKRNNMRMRRQKTNKKQYKSKIGGWVYKSNERLDSQSSEITTNSGSDSKTKTNSNSNVKGKGLRKTKKRHSHYKSKAKSRSHTMQ